MATTKQQLLGAGQLKRNANPQTGNDIFLKVSIKIHKQSTSLVLTIWFDFLSYYFHPFVSSCTSRLMSLWRISASLFSYIEARVGHGSTSQLRRRSGGKADPLLPEALSSCERKGSTDEQNV